MGLSLSVWLCNRINPSPPSTSSVFSLLAVPTSSRLAITLKAPPAVTPADKCSQWSSVHCSPNFLLSPCKQEVTRLPVEQCSDGVRAEMGVSSGLHVWVVMWIPDHRGSHAVLGISGQRCPLQVSGYNVLIGGDSESWGWELRTNQLWHAGQRLRPYPDRPGRPKCEDAERCGPKVTTKTAQLPLPIPERILLVLDADAGTLGFSIDGSFMGVAFKDLPRGVALFPAVSSVRGGASIRLRYLNGARREWLFPQCWFKSMEDEFEWTELCFLSTPGDPPALMDLCALSIQHHVGQQRHNQIRSLPLPTPLQHYLLSTYTWKHLQTTGKNVFLYEYIHHCIVFILFIMTEL